LTCTRNSSDGQNLISFDEDIANGTICHRRERDNDRPCRDRNIANLTCSFNSCDGDIDNDGNCNCSDRTYSLNAGNSQNLISNNKDRTKFSSSFDPILNYNSSGDNYFIAKLAGSLNPVLEYIGVGGDGDIANKARGLNARDFDRNSDEDLNITKLRCALYPVREYVGGGYNKDITKLTSGFNPSYGNANIAAT